MQRNKLGSGLGLGSDPTFNHNYGLIFSFVSIYIQLLLVAVEEWTTTTNHQNNAMVTSVVDCQDRKIGIAIRSVTSFIAACKQKIAKGYFEFRNPFAFRNQTGTIQCRPSRVAEGLPSPGGG